jgi:predicted signal transduction protein with EAL and GGDEF domain
VELTGESNSLEEILSAADSACYVAKKQGDSHVHVYSSHDEVVARSRGEIQWLQRLQAALRDGFFELYIQPIEATRPNSTGGPRWRCSCGCTTRAMPSPRPSSFRPRSVTA